MPELNANIDVKTNVSHLSRWILQDKADCAIQETNLLVKTTVCYLMEPLCYSHNQKCPHREEAEKKMIETARAY